MRVAMLSWESLHSIAVGGVAAHVTELAAALERQGHEVHVFTRRAPGQRAHDRIHSVHYHRCTYPGHPDFIDDVNNMCRVFVDRVFEVEDFVGHFDIIHAHDWLTANALIWIKQGRGHKGVLTIHATEYARCGSTLSGGRSQRIRDQERAGMYWADRVIAVSVATRSEIRWMYEVPESKIPVIYNGVSAHRFDVDIDPGTVKRRFGIGPMDPTVLFCGRLTHQKGPDILLEAIPPILRHHARAKFVFAGDGDLRGALEARARHLGVAQAVRFLGCRNGNELVSLFKMADTLCVPSRNEPFGIVVLEAWSAHKPVVVTQCGGPNEYVRHEETGLKIYPRVDSVAWGLKALFDNFDRARWMGENGRREVDEHFTWDKIAEQTLAVYDPDHTLRAPKPQEAKPEATLAPPAVLQVAHEAESAEDAAREAEKEETPGSPLRVALKLSLRRRRRGLSVADSKAACEQALAEAGLPVTFRRNTVSVEGDWETVLSAANRCYRLVDEIGKANLVATVRLPGAVDELLAWEESEEPADSRMVAAGMGILPTHATYVEGT